MKSTRHCLDKLKTLSICEGSLKMTYCAKPEGIERYFSEDTRLKSFPPNGIADITELDCFYLITLDNQVIGYYKAVDLFFEGKIELHGSYDGPQTFLIKTYFFLTKKFVETVQKCFPDKLIVTLIHKDNAKIVRLLQWLNFQIDPKASNENNTYIKYFYRQPESLSLSKKIIHWIYTK